MALVLTSDVARKYSQRGRLKSLKSRWQVEGESVTAEVIGARLGIAESTAMKRVKREQQKPGPVTWAGLALPGGV